MSFLYFLEDEETAGIIYIYPRATSFRVYFADKM